MTDLRKELALLIGPDYAEEDALLYVQDYGSELVVYPADTIPDIFDYTITVSGLSEELEVLFKDELNSVLEESSGIREMSVNGDGSVSIYRQQTSVWHA